MKLSEKTIKALEQIITGDSNISPYRSGPKLVDFFNGFGRNDVYGAGFPSRWQYARDAIRSFNEADTLRKIVEACVDPRDYKTPEQNNSPWQQASAQPSFSVEKVVEHLNEYLAYDNYRLVKDEIKNLYKVQTRDGSVVSIKETLSTLSHDFISEQLQKANDKLASADYDGAITNARSLVEAIQEEIIRKAGVDVPDYGGDLNKLYKTTKKVLNFDVEQKDLSDTLKQILSGLNSLNAGLAGLSNKMADRHARQYKPDKHHAKLAVNAAFTLCEFLLDSFEYQQSKIGLKKSA